MALCGKRGIRCPTGQHDIINKLLGAAAIGSCSPRDRSGMQPAGAAPAGGEYQIQTHSCASKPKSRQPSLPRISCAMSCGAHQHGHHKFHPMPERATYTTPSRFPLDPVPECCPKSHMPQPPPKLPTMKKQIQT
jgi:hypothetical protein